ncbi:MAG: hypothetical protein JNL87_16650 [Burkholderiaceae bacterium]|nr:hypothetical protein [Burkholderiaceae bacterium]
MTLHAVPVIGGRLMGMAWQGHELCFIHPALAGRMPDIDDPEAWAQCCEGWHFPLWGGGKTWIAPQSGWPCDEPWRDLDSGCWQASVSGFRGDILQMVSPVCRQSGLQVRRSIQPGPGDGTWTIEHQVMNWGNKPFTLGLWDVLMLRRPGTVIARLTAPNTLEATEGQPPLAWLAEQDAMHLDGVGLALHCRDAAEWKVGLSASPAALQVELAAGSTPLRYVRTLSPESGARYAHGHPLEVFNAPVLPYFEVESHSPLRCLSPGQSLIWRVEESLRCDRM